MRRLGLLLLLCAMATTAMAAGQLKLIQLQHRSAEEIIPLLRPLLPPETTLSGKAYQLIIRTSPANLAELESLIAQLDSKPAQLQISVRMGGERIDNQQGGSLSGQYQNGTGKVTVKDGDEPSGNGLQLDAKGKHMQGQVKIYQTDDRQNENITQQLRVTEGQWATIQTGQSIPIIQQEMLHGPSGIVMRQGTEYQQVSSGFQVRPLIRGDRVTLEIRPQHDRLSRQGAGIIETQSLTTTVSGRVGEWVELGNSRETDSQDRQGRSYSNQQHRQRNTSIYLKVDALR